MPQNALRDGGVLAKGRWCGCREPFPGCAWRPRPVQCIKNGKYVAIKCMKTTFPSVDQVNNLREIQALRRLCPHPNIVKLEEVL
jgi:hypothetical protein